MLVGEFDPVSPGTARYVALDFTADLDQGDAVATGAVAVSVSAISTAPDPNAGALAAHAPVVAGNEILQWLGGPFVAGQSGFSAGRDLRRDHDRDGGGRADHRPLRAAAVYGAPLILPGFSEASTAAGRRARQP